MLLTGFTEAERELLLLLIEHKKPEIEQEIGAGGWRQLQDRIVRDTESGSWSEQELIILNRFLLAKVKEIGDQMPPWSPSLQDFRKVHMQFKPYAEMNTKVEKLLRKMGKRKSWLQWW